MTKFTSLTIMVPIEQIMGNPLNPRSDSSIQSDLLESIIRSKGWEEPLTAYKKGDMYVLLAGHRRLFAAKKAKNIKEIPIYVVDAPKDELEEITRLGSLQSARVDWSQYDYAKYVHQCWVAWGKPSFKKLADMLALSKRAVEEYVMVIEYYPTFEIETNLHNKSLSISALYALYVWIKELKKHKPDLVAGMTEDMIRKVMVEKIINKRATRDDLRRKEFCKLAPTDVIRDFLINKEEALDVQVGYYALKKKYTNFNGHLISIGHIENRIPNIKPETEHQKEKAIEALEDLVKLVQKQLEEIRKG